MLADRARLQLHPRGAQAAAFLIGRQHPLDVAGAGFHLGGERDRVLHRHARPLREILQHRMGGIAKEGDIATAPAGDGRAVADQPPALMRQQLQELVDLVGEAIEGRGHILE